MKPFRFTLQALLTLRHHQEQQALEAYARALESRRLACLQRDSIQQQLQSVRADLHHQLTNGTTAAFITQSHAYSRLLELRLHQAAQHLAAADQSVANALQSMVAARQLRETVETLRERRLEVHATQSRRLEGRLLDELATRRSPTSLFGTKALCARS
jgi:flagellar export protein FliJ